MKIATWNVNGIRARQAQVQQWIERDRPDVVLIGTGSELQLAYRAAEALARHGLDPKGEPLPGTATGAESAAPGALRAAERR